MARETITLNESGIKLVPPMDVVVNFFGGFAAWFLKDAVPQLTLLDPLVSERK